jgi:hypothetical protein
VPFGELTANVSVFVDVSVVVDLVLDGDGDDVGRTARSPSPRPEQAARSHVGAESRAIPNGGCIVAVAVASTSRTTSKSTMSLPKGSFDTT